MTLLVDGTGEGTPVPRAVMVLQRRPTAAAGAHRGPGTSEASHHASPPSPGTPRPGLRQACVAVLSTSLMVEQELLPLLRHQGYTASGALTMTELTRLVTLRAPDLVLLPRAPGNAPDLDALGRLRAAGSHAVIVVIGEPDDDSEVINCLDLGADDYVTAPLPHAVLLARIRAQLRGQARLPPPPPRRPRAVPTLDPAAGSIVVGRRELRVRGRQYRLLAHLVTHRDRIVPAEELASRLWPTEHPPSPGALASLLHALRGKLRALTPGVGEIVTVRRHGYRYDPPWNP